MNEMQIGDSAHGTPRISIRSTNYSCPLEFAVVLLCASDNHRKSRFPPAPWPPMPRPDHPGNSSQKNHAERKVDGPLHDYSGWLRQYRPHRDRLWTWRIPRAKPRWPADIVPSCDGRRGARRIFGSFQSEYPDRAPRRGYSVSYRPSLACVVRLPRRIDLHKLNPISHKIAPHPQACSQNENECRKQHRPTGDPTLAAHFIRSAVGLTPSSGATPRASIAPAPARRNWLFYLRHQEQIQSRDVIGHGDGNQSPVPRDRDVFR